MIIEEKKTESYGNNAKERFELPVVEIIIFEIKDNITTSGGFSGEDDPAV